MKYISKYSNNKEVTPQQYITELICENKAIKDKKDLYYRFWTNKEWAAYYKNQIATANKLVKQYNPLAIIRALKDIKAQKIFSLRAPHLISIIEKEQEKLESENKSLSLEFDRKQDKTFHNNRSSKSILSKLKDIDNES